MCENHESLDNNIFFHETVLKSETITAIFPTVDVLEEMLQKNLPFVLVDATLGGGGHLREFLSKWNNLETSHKPILKVFAFDKDISALEYSRNFLKSFITDTVDISYVHASYSTCKEILRALSYSINALYADLGVSSQQLNLRDRGFSLKKSGPLDMRMDTYSPIKARDILMESQEEYLSNIFFKYGEEPKAKLLAAAIVKDRVSQTHLFEDTLSFAEYVRKTLAYRDSRMHPATRIFQALRMVVNDELEDLRALLRDIPNIVAQHAKVAFISFNSLEDRCIKQCMRAWECGCTELKSAPEMALLKEIGRLQSLGKEKPRGGSKASISEIEENVRSRSARLRVFLFSLNSEFRTHILHSVATK